MVMSDLPNGRALARSFLVTEQRKYAVNQRVCRIRPQRGSSAYLCYQLNRIPELLRNDDGKEQTHLSNSAFTLLQLVEPPDDEQQRIAVHLDKVISSLKWTEMQLEASMERLNEYCHALVTNAVTGQLPELNE
jgi:type I restriction enzyme S subunit